MIKNEICPHCHTEIEVMGKEPAKLCEPVDKIRLARNHNVPFWCDYCGAIKFPYRPIRELVFIWDAPLPQYYDNSGIVMPESYRKHYKDGHGIIIAHGSWWYDKKYKICKTSLKIGYEVYYNKDVPWSLPFKGSDDKVHKVVFCGEPDVWVRVINE